MPVTDDGRLRLAELVKHHRRRVQRLTVKEAAEAGEIASGTWTRIEQAQPVRDLSYAGIDQALKWVPGSAEKVLAGESDVELLADREKENKTAEIDEALRRALQQVAGFPVGRGLDAEAEGLTDEQVEAVKVIIRGMRGK